MINRQDKMPENKSDALLENKEDDLSKAIRQASNAILEFYDKMNNFSEKMNSLKHTLSTLTQIRSRNAGVLIEYYTKNLFQIGKLDHSLLEGIHKPSIIAPADVEAVCVSPVEKILSILESENTQRFFEACTKGASYEAWFKNLVDYVIEKDRRDAAYFALMQQIPMPGQYIIRIKDLLDAIRKPISKVNQLANKNSRPIITMVKLSERLDKTFNFLESTVRSINEWLRNPPMPLLTVCEKLRIDLSNDPQLLEFALENRTNKKAILDKPPTPKQNILESLNRLLDECIAFTYQKMDSYQRKFTHHSINNAIYEINRLPDDTKQFTDILDKLWSENGALFCMIIEEDGAIQSVITEILLNVFTKIPINQFTSGRLHNCSPLLPNNLFDTNLLECWNQKDVMEIIYQMKSTLKEYMEDKPFLPRNKNRHTEIIHYETLLNKFNMALSSKRYDLIKQNLTILLRFIDENDKKYKSSSKLHSKMKNYNKALIEKTKEFLNSLKKSVKIFSEEVSKIQGSEYKKIQLPLSDTSDSDELINIDEILKSPTPIDPKKPSTYFSDSKPTSTPIVDSGLFGINPAPYERKLHESLISPSIVMSNRVQENLKDDEVDEIVSHLSSNEKKLSISAETGLYIQEKALNDILSVFDKHKNTPKQRNLTIAIDSILHKYPSSIFQHNAQGLLPVDIARQCNLPDDVIFRLEQAEYVEDMRQSDILLQQMKKSLISKGNDHLEMVAMPAKKESIISFFNDSIQKEKMIHNNIVKGGHALATNPITSISDTSDLFRRGHENLTATERAQIKLGKELLNVKLTRVYAEALAIKYKLLDPHSKSYVGTIVGGALSVIGTLLITPPVGLLLGAAILVSKSLLTSAAEEAEVNRVKQQQSSRLGEIETIDQAAKHIAALVEGLTHRYQLIFAQLDSKSMGVFVKIIIDRMIHYWDDGLKRLDQFGIDRHILGSRLVDLNNLDKLNHHCITSPKIEGLTEAKLSELGGEEKGITQAKDENSEFNFYIENMLLGSSLYQGRRVNTSSRFAKISTNDGMLAETAAKIVGDRKVYYQTPCGRRSAMVQQICSASKAITWKSLGKNDQVYPQYLFCEVEHRNKNVQQSYGLRELVISNAECHLRGYKVEGDKVLKLSLPIPPAGFVLDPQQMIASLKARLAAETDRADNAEAKMEEVIRYASKKGLVLPFSSASQQHTSNHFIAHSQQGFQDTLSIDSISRDKQSAMPLPSNSSSYRTSVALSSKSSTTQITMDLQTPSFSNEQTTSTNVKRVFQQQLAVKPNSLLSSNQHGSLCSSQSFLTLSKRDSNQSLTDSLSSGSLTPKSASGF